MSEPRKISDLGYALLGLLKMQANSGYGLRKIFDTTPMGRYSSSPGAIYPALARLQSQGLIKGAADKSTSKRPKQMLQVTTKGARALNQWLRQPVTLEQIVWNNDMLMLRFSFLDLLDDLQFSEEFLKELRRQTQLQAKATEAFRTAMVDRMPLHGRLALERGIELQAATLRWCTSALRAIRRVQRSTS